MSIIAAFLTQTGALLAGESICVDMAGARLPPMAKLLPTGSSSAAAFVGCTEWSRTDGAVTNTRAALAAHCERLRLARPSSIEDQAQLLAAGVASTHGRIQPNERTSEYFRSVKGIVLSIMTAGLDPAGTAAIGLSRVRFQDDAARFVPQAQSGPPVAISIAWPARTPAALATLQSRLCQSDDPSVRAVMAVVTGQPRAPLPTAQAARTFFGWLVETAIAHASDVDVVAAAWPIDVIEISRSGIREQQYRSLDEMTGRGSPNSQVPGLGNLTSHGARRVRNSSNPLLVVGQVMRRYNLVFVCREHLREGLSRLGFPLQPHGARQPMDAVEDGEVGADGAARDPSPSPLVVPAISP